MNWISQCAGLHPHATVNYDFILEQGLCFLTNFKKNVTQCENGHLINTPFYTVHREQVINAVV